MLESGPVNAADFNDIINHLLPDIIVSGHVDPEACRAAMPEDIEELRAILRNAVPRVEVEEEVLGCLTSVAAERLAAKGEALVLGRPLNYIGYRMNARKATICVGGGAGQFLGAFMEAGAIVCEGDCGHFAFRGASGGRALIMGSAGDYCSEELHGSVRVRVMGNVGRSAARRMMGGELRVEGDAGPFFCRYMEAGTAHAREVELLGETFGGIIHVRKVKAREKENDGRHDATLIVDTPQSAPPSQ